MKKNTIDLRKITIFENITQPVKFKKVVVHNNIFYFKHNNEMFQGVMYDYLISFAELKISKQYKKLILYREHTRTTLIDDLCLGKLSINKYRSPSYSVEEVKKYCINYLDKFYLKKEQHSKYI